MQRVANSVALFGLAGLMSLGAGRSAAAQMAAPVRIADVTGPVEPVHRKETRNSYPSADAAWVPGFWDLRGDPRTAPRAGWVWVPGRWLAPPVPDARWDPGHWGWDRGWYSWVPAHWVVPGRRGYPADLPSDVSTEVEMSAP